MIRDYIKMPEIGENRVLSVSTDKQQGRGARTIATLGTAGAGGHGFETFSFIICKDFSKVVHSVPAARITDKVIAACHAAALAKIEEIKATVVAHYAAQEKMA